MDLNIKFSDDIIEIFDYIGEKIGISIDWTSANVLPKIEELCGKYIMWELNTSYAWIIIMWAVVIITVAVSIFLYKLYVKCDNEFRETDDRYVIMIIGIVISLLLLFIAIMVTGEQILDIIECKCFPEKMIYEFISEKINTVQTR